MLYLEIGFFLVASWVKQQKEGGTNRVTFCDIRI